MSEKSTKRKPACLNCRRSHTRCDDQRPCSRCSSLGLVSTCVEVPRRAQIKWHSQPYPPSGSFSGEPEPMTVFTESGITESWWKSAEPSTPFQLIKCDGKFLQLVNYSAEEILFLLTLDDLVGTRNPLTRSILSANRQIGPLECRIKTGAGGYKNVLCTASLVDRGETEAMGGKFSSESEIVHLVMQDREEIGGVVNLTQPLLDQPSDCSSQFSHFMASTSPQNFELLRESVFKSQNLVPARRTVSLGSYEHTGRRDSQHQSDWKWIDNNGSQQRNYPSRHQNGLTAYYTQFENQNYGTCSYPSYQNSNPSAGKNALSLSMSADSCSTSVTHPRTCSDPDASLKTHKTQGSYQMERFIPHLPVSHSSGNGSFASSSSSSSPHSPLSPLPRDIHSSNIQTSLSPSPQLSPSSHSLSETFFRFDDLRLFSSPPSTTRNQNQNQTSRYSSNQHQSSQRTTLPDVEIPPRDFGQSMSVPLGGPISPGSSNQVFLPSLIKSSDETKAREDSSSANRTPRKDPTAKSSLQMILN